MFLEASENTSEINPKFYEETRDYYRAKTSKLPEVKYSLVNWQEKLFNSVLLNC